MRQDLARHDALLRRAIELHDGEVFKTIGDAFCVAFADPRQAVAAAVVAQRALHKELPQIRVRMAIHTGEAEARDGDYFGPALNRVARLLNAGHGGQVLLSAAATEVVRGALPEDTELQPLGTHQLRDIVETETIFQVLPPDLPKRFPPLNTVNVAKRQGALRMALVSSVVLALVGSLAVHNARLARAERRQHIRAEYNLYIADLERAQAALEQGNRAAALRLLASHQPRPGDPDHRGWEWRYLQREARDQSEEQLSRSGMPLCLAYTPDGKHLLSATDSSVVLRDLARRHDRLLIGRGSVPPQGAALSADGRTVAAIRRDGAVDLWDARTGMLFGTLRDPARGGRLADPGWRSQVLFSSDSRLLITIEGFLTEGKQIRLWDVASRRLTAYVEDEPFGLTCAAICPDGETLALGTDFTLELWSLSKRKRLRRLAAGLSGLRTLACSPDGKLLAGGGFGTLKIWDLQSGGELALMESPEPVFCLAFSGGGRTLAVGGAQNTLDLWDVAARRVRRRFIGHTSSVGSIAASPAGRQIASAEEGGTRIWTDGAEALEPVAPARLASSLAFTPDGLQVVVCDGQSTNIHSVRDLHRRARLRHTTIDPVQSSCAVSPDSILLAIASTADPQRARHGSVTLWDLRSRRRLATLPLNPFGAPVFSPDGRLIAFPSTNYRQFEVAIYEVQSRRRLGSVAATPDGGPAAPVSVTFSPDGRTLAVGHMRGRLSLWSTETRQLMRELKGHTDWCVPAFSPDGKILASASDDSSVRLWSMADGSQVAVLRGHRTAVSAASFSPDGRRLATSSFDRTIKLWDLATHQELLTIRGFKRELQRVHFSPDGRTLAVLDTHELRLLRTD